MIGSTRGDDGHGVGHEAAAHHVREGLQVHEARASDAQSVGLGAAIGHDVAAQLPAGRFHRRVGLPRRHLEALGEELEVVDQGLHRLVDAGPGRRGDLLVLHPVVAAGHALDDLADQPHRLADLVQADGVAVEGVAVGADHDVEVQLVVGQVGLVPAQVPGVAGGAQDGPGGPEGQGLVGGDDPDALQALPPDGLAGHQGVVLLQPGRDEVEQGQDASSPAVGQVGGHATGADVVVVHPQAGDRLEEAQDLLALAPAEEHHRDRAEVHAVGGQEEQVAGDAVHLGHQHPDPGGPDRDLDPEELLDGQRERQLVEQRRGVVHAGDVGGALQVGQGLARLLHAGVQVADDRLGPQDGLTLELEHEPQHAVGRRVLGTHVDDHRLVVGSADVRSRAAASASDRRSTAPISRRRSAPPRACGIRPWLSLGGLGDRGRRSRPRCRSCGRLRPSPAPLNCTGMAPTRVVLAQGVAVPVLGHEDPGQVGMALEDDAEHVEHLALEGVGPGVQVDDGRHGRVVGRDLDAQAGPGRVLVAQEGRPPARSARGRRRGRRTGAGWAR